MKLKKVFPIVAMLLIVLMAGCKKDDNTGVSPTVTSTDPLNNVAGVPRNKKAKKQFFNFPFTFIWFSDLHIGDPSWQGGQIDDFVGAMSIKNPDFVVSSGDNILANTQNDADIDIAAYSAAMAVLTMPLYTLQGNADSYWNFGSNHFVVDKENIRLIAFHAYLIEGDLTYHEGQVSAEELVWIEEQLQSAGNKRCILMCHWPLSGLFDSGMNIQPGYGQEEIISLCNKYAVKLFLNGHTHGSNQIAIVGNNTTEINGYAAVGANKFMVCTIYSDRIVITPYNGTAPFAATTPVRVVYF